jgi:hypothetical protein
LREAKTLGENASTLVLIAALFLHLGVLQPALVSERLKIGHQSEQKLRFSESTLALGEVSQVKDEAPMNLPRDGYNLGEDVLDDSRESVLLLFLHVAENLLVLVLRVGCFNQVASQRVHSVFNL